MTIHDLKIAPMWFDAISLGAKTYEVRHTADRTFAYGDIVVLREWIADMGRATGQYTGRYLIRTVGCVLGVDFEGAPAVVFSLVPVGAEGGAA